MILQHGLPGNLPKEFAMRPIVILDHGVSTDYSVLLDCWRKWIRASIAAQCKMDVSRIRPRVYIIYAENEHICRYGAGHIIESFVPDNYYQHEVRPRKRNPINIVKRTRKYGMAWSFYRMETNSHKSGLTPPWRWSKYGDDQPRHDRRPITIIVEPDPKDLKFLHDNEKLWKRFDRLPRVWVGAAAVGHLPHSFMRWLDGIVGFTAGGFIAASKAVEGLNTAAARVPTTRLLTPGSPKYDYGIAHNWDAGAKRCRTPDLGQFILSKIAPGSQYTPPTGRNALELLEAINCRHYLVLSNEESMAPYDGLLALAGGANVYAPDVPAWKTVKSENPLQVSLYPVRSQGNNRCVWNALDVATFLKARIG